ncbi:unnamed protein product, partial [Effrenium voratum]
HPFARPPGLSGASAMVRPCSHRRGRHGRGLLLLLLSWTILNGLVFVAPPRAPARASARGLVTLQADAEPEPDEKRSWPARYFLAAKDAIQTALFGSPESPETASNAPHNPLEGVTGVILNATSTAVSGATSGVKAVEAAAGSCGSWCGSRLQELGSALHLTSESGGSAEVAAADASEAPEAPAGGGLFQEAPDSGAQPGDFFLFIKDYSWSLRYRVRNQSDSVDIERPGQPVEALKWLREAQALAPQLPKKALAVLYQQEAKIHECQEDYVSALFVFQHGLKIHRSEDPARRVVHMELLKQALAGDGVPPAVAASMQREAEDLARALVQGGHGRVGQFPRSFVPGLSARPWWPVEAELWDAGHPELPEVPWQSAALAEVRAAKDHLLQEYQDLKARDLLDTDRECIASSGEMWRSFQVEAPWRQETCEEASVTPVACRLLAALRGKEGNVAAPLLRGGYSAVAAKGRLRPHFGTSNAQLKWHLGLAIPSDGGKPCAWLRVGNETRAWREGEVLFFDDSFEHEVSNTCSEERVVFQLVFAHPDLQRHS